MKSFLRKSYTMLSDPLRSLKFRHLNVQVQCDRQWYGNEYGGFYLNPNLVKDRSVVYSFGIGEDISFDRAVIDRHQCEVFGFDPTPKSIEWVKKGWTPDTFHFYPFGIARESGMASFNLPANPDYVSGSVVNHSDVATENKIDVEMRSFHDIHDLLGHDKIDVLKMDIEGSEYDVISSILEEGVDITQIALELHERFFPNGSERSKQLVATLNKFGYKIFARSKSYEELSFVKETALR